MDGEGEGEEKGGNEASGSWGCTGELPKGEADPEGEVESGESPPEE
jgi:hypothetical protein